MTVHVARPASVLSPSSWGDRLALAGLVIVVAVLLLALVGWLVPRLVSAAEARSGKTRSRQRQTAISALATSIRYVVVFAALLGVALALVGGSGTAALSGGALVALIVGFASQRLLLDVIAGFFILFEDQYGVGDTVRLEASGYTGRVLDLGLRTTVLAGPDGERMVVPNGQVTAVRVIPSGRRRHRLELVTDDPDTAGAAIVELVGPTGRGGPWLSEPRIVRNEAEGGRTRMVVILDVDARREDAVAWLADALVARLGDTLQAPPLHGINLAGV